MYRIVIHTQFESNVPMLVSTLHVPQFSDAIHFSYQIKAATAHVAVPRNMEILITNLDVPEPLGNTYQIIDDYDKAAACFKQAFAGWYDTEAPHNRLRDTRDAACDECCHAPGFH